MARPPARDRARRPLPRALLRVHAEGRDRVPALAPGESGQRDGLRRARPREPPRRPGADLQRDVGAPEPAPPARRAGPARARARGAARVPRPGPRGLARVPGRDEGDALARRGVRVPRARRAPRARRHDGARPPDERADAGGRARRPARVAAAVVRRLRGLPPPRVGGGAGRARRRLPPPRSRAFRARSSSAPNAASRRCGSSPATPSSRSARSGCSSPGSRSRTCRSSSLPRSRRCSTRCSQAVHVVGSELGGAYFATRVVLPGPYAQQQQQQ